MFRLCCCGSNPKQSFIAFRVSSAVPTAALKKQVLARATAAFASCSYMSLASGGVILSPMKCLSWRSTKPFCHALRNLMRGSPKSSETDTVSAISFCSRPPYFCGC